MIGRDLEAVLEAARLEDELATMIDELRATPRPAYPQLAPVLESLRALSTRFANAAAIIARLDALEAAARRDDLEELAREAAALRRPGPGTFGTWAI